MHVIKSRFAPWLGFVAILSMILYIYGMIFTFTLTKEVKILKISFTILQTLFFNRIKHKWSNTVQNFRKPPLNDFKYYFMKRHNASSVKSMRKKSRIHRKEKRKTVKEKSSSITDAAQDSYHSRPAISK